MKDEINITGKTRSESRSIMTELVLPNDANLIGNLLGGKLLHYIDISGALAATRHSGGLVATKLIDMVEFSTPIKVGNIVEFTSYVTWTGKTSIEVAVDAFSEDTLTGERKFINKVYLVFVAIDKEGKKRPSPGLIPENDVELQEFAEGELRQKLRRHLT